MLLLLIFTAIYTLKTLPNIVIHILTIKTGAVVKTSFLIYSNLTSCTHM